MAIPQKLPYTEDDYYALPEDVRAELINGQIYYQAAPGYQHQKILGNVYAAIHTCIKSKNGPCEVLPAPFAVRLFDDRKTIVEPDISVICDPGKITDNGCSGAPDWVIEIVSPGNSSHDYVRKLNLYLDAGVREYWIVNPMKEIVFVYHLEETKFEVSSYTFQDRVKVNIYDDLWIDFQDVLPSPDAVFL